MAKMMQEAQFRRRILSVGRARKKAKMLVFQGFRRRVQIPFMLAVQ
jgi:hypothetical protein